MMRQAAVVIIFLLSGWCRGHGVVPALPDTPVVLAPTEWLGTAGFRGRSVARDSRSWVYAAYVQGSLHRIRCSRSTDNGRTWSNLGEVSVEDALYPNLGIGNQDTLHVVWTRPMLDVNGMDIFWSCYDGTSWSLPLNISNQHYQNNNGMFCSMALDTSGHPHVVWQKGGNIWYSFYDGAAWSAPELATSPAWYLSLASDRRNRLHLIHDTPSYYLCRNSGVWGPPEQFAPTNTGYPSIAVDAFDRPQACWSGVSDSGADIFYAYRDTMAAGWTAPVRLSYTPGAGSRYPSLSDDRLGRKYVVWCDWPVNWDSTNLYWGNLWWGRYDGAAWRTDFLRYDTLYMDWEPSVGFPVSDSGVDVVWTQGPRFGPYRVMYWRLPLLPSGVEVEKPVAPRGEGLQLSVQSPVRSQLVVRYHLPSHVSSLTSHSLSLYGLSGRKLAVLKEGEGSPGWHEARYPPRLPSGVYFLRLVAGKVNLTRKVVVIR